MKTLMPPPPHVTIWPMGRDTQPAAVNLLYKSGDAPMLAVIDDTGEANAGPSGWPGAPKILAWARAIEIRVAGPSDDHAMAQKAARKFRRVLVVITPEQHAAAWCSAAAFTGCRHFLPLAPKTAPGFARRGAR